MFKKMNHFHSYCQKKNNFYYYYLFFDTSYGKEDSIEFETVTIKQFKK